MAQWGKYRRFTYKDVSYQVIPHFDTGVVSHRFPNNPDDPGIADRLTEYCKGMTPDQWERCDPRAILGDALPSYAKEFNENQTADLMTGLPSPKFRYIDVLVDILVNAGNPEEVRRIAGAALKGLS